MNKEGTRMRVAYNGFKVTCRSRTEGQAKVKTDAETCQRKSRKHARGNTSYVFWCVYYDEVHVNKSWERIQNKTDVECTKTRCIPVRKQNNIKQKQGKKENKDRKVRRKNERPPRRQNKCDNRIKTNPDGIYDDTFEFILAVLARQAIRHVS